jgi:hypothetical protein
MTLEMQDDSTLDTLEVDPFDDDLSAELAKRAPRGAPGRTTLALGGAVLIVAGFLGGVVVQKNWGTTTPSANAGAGAGAGAGGGFAGRGGTGTASAAPGGTRGGAAAPTTGTVKFVDGTTVYLTTATGETITVKTTGTTTVRTEQTTSLADIPVGATVSVTGTTDADGNLTATQVTTTK